MSRNTDFPMDVPDDNRTAFEDSLKQLREAIGHAMFISIRTANRHVPRRIQYAHWLHTRLCTVGMTMDKIASSKDSDSRGETFTLDHISLAALARSTIETCLMVYYLSDQTVDETEWSFRNAILRLHDTTIRYRMFKTVDEEQAADFRKGIDEIRSEIRAHPLFAQRSPQDQKTLLNGQTIFVNGMRSVVKSVGWNTDRFDLAHTYFPQQAHSAPVSFFRTGRHQTDYDSPSEQQLALPTMAVRYASSVTDAASQRIIALLPDIAEYAPAWMHELRSARSSMLFRDETVGPD